MNVSGSNICNEITPSEPVCVLLPLCIELEIDVFLNILKNVVARSKLDDHYLDALKAGMNSNAFYIKSSDVLVNWKELNSNSQRFRQLKLLGFWAAYNYPALGKKLLGEAWQPPQRKHIVVLGDSEMTADAIDALIFRKMELRIIELSVSQSTLAKLKYFVRTPVSVAKFGESPISPKMKTFQIEENHLEHCWKALKFGTFSVIEKPVNLSETKQGKTRTETQNGVIRKERDPQMVPVVKRLRLDEITKTITVNSDRGINESGSLRVTERVREHVDTDADSTLNSIRMDVLDMRKELADLTKWLHTTGSETKNPERLYDMVLKQKDEELVQVKASTEKILRENANMHLQIERNSGLTDSLQKGLDASLKLQTKSEILESSLQKRIEDLTKNVCEAEKQNLQLSEKHVKLEAELDGLKSHATSGELLLQNQVQDLIKSFAEAEKSKLQLTEEIGKLDEELNRWKNSSVSKEKELIEAKKLMKEQDSLMGHQINDLVIKFSEADKVNLQLSETNVKLEEELSGMKSYITSVESNLQNQIQELTKNLVEAEQSKVLLTQQVGKLNEEVNGWKAAVSEKAEKLIETSKLKEELLSLRNYTNILVPELKIQIQDLDQSLAEAQRRNLEVTSKNDKLVEELNTWKNCTSTEEKEQENTKITKTQSQMREPDMPMSVEALPELPMQESVHFTRKSKRSQQNQKSNRS